MGDYAELLESWREKWQIRPGNWMMSQEILTPLEHQEEVYYETEASRKILKLISNFYNKLDVLEKYKKNKRSYLLHSEPGMGKSSLIRHICRKISDKKDFSIIHAPGDSDFDTLGRMFATEYDENVKMIVLVIEDMGYRNYGNNSSYWNSSCLSFLDGQSGIFRVPTLVIATTNFPKELGPQLTNRPGRFNQLIKVHPPTDEEIFDLIEGFKGIFLTPQQKEALAGKELTPDHCIEAVLRSEIDSLSIEDAVSQLLAEREGFTEWRT